MNELEPLIDKLWERRAELSPESGGDSRLTVERAIAMLDAGVGRVAEPSDGEWRVNQWLKKAVLLSFRINSMKMITGGPGGGHWWDKVPSKFAGWSDRQFAQGGFRAVPGAIVRRGAYIAPGAVLMPSFVNVGAYVGENSMIDTWATVGSCAQIGSNVHISGGAGIGGVLEPLQAGPVIIEDDCFIGARSEVAEGVIVEKARCCRWACSSAPRPRLSTGQPARSISAACPPIRWSSPAALRARTADRASPVR